MAKKKKSGATRKRRGNRKKPFLAVAVLCEKILREEDNVISLVRLFDTFNLSGETPTIPPGVATTNMYLQFKSGEAIGTRRLSVVGRSPSGEETTLFENRIDFNGGEGGAVASIDLKLAVKEAGLYWFDVMINDELMTKIPLRVQYRRTPKESGGRPRRTKRSKSPSE